MSDKKTPILVTEGPAFERAGLVHRVLVPEGEGPFKTSVLLHGLRGNEDVMWVFQRAIPRDWLVIAPRAIEPDPVDGYAWHPRQPDEWPDLVMFDEAVAAVVRFIEALPDLYRADLDHLYLMGFSQGAATSFATAMRHPQLVHGIAGLVGFAPENWEGEVSADVLDGLPVFMAVGTEDETIPIARSRESAGILRAAGADLTYREYETGHKLNAQGMRDLKEWFSER